MRTALAIASAILTAGAAPSPWYPDPIATPGVVNLSVTQDTIHNTICKPGWSTSVRPPKALTEARKRHAVLSQKDRTLSHWQWDHFLGIDMGGDPIDIRNQWLEPEHGICGALVKDQLDRNLPRLICNGIVPLREAQMAVMSDWVAAYNKYRIGPHLVCP